MTGGKEGGNDLYPEPRMLVLVAANRGQLDRLAFQTTSTLQPSQQGWGERI